MPYLTNVTHVYYNLLCISPFEKCAKEGEKNLLKKMDQKSVKLMREKIREIGKSARKSTRMGILSHSQPFDEDGPSGRTQDEKVRIFLSLYLYPFFYS